MQVEILFDGTLIGRSNLRPSDPTMAVAMGEFEPSSAYDVHVHAGEIDGVHIGERAYNLPYAIISIGHGVIRHEGVFIQDFSDSLDERHISVIIPDPDYETFFGKSLA
ncbi:MAG: hypothetical protein ABIQ32_06720 [Sphingomicrobium sp.]